MTTDRHKHPPIRYRPSAANRERIAAHARQTGLPINRILNEALTAFWQAIDRGPTTRPADGHAVGPLGIEILVDDRQPAGVISVVAPGEDKTEVRAFALAPEDVTPVASRKQGAKGPCEHRIPPGSYCARCGRLI